MKKIKGIIPPMVTPLKSQDVLDVEGVDRLVDHLVDGGVNAIFILGTSGEAQSLSHLCKIELIERVAARINGRIPMLVGVTDTSLTESLAMAKIAQENGAAGVVATPPYYFTPSQDELAGYYRAMADDSPLPLFLYNMPSNVHMNIAVPTAVLLSEHPNIAGLKDSSANMSYFRMLSYRLRDKKDFALYVGPEELTGESVLLGADGGINGGANLFPELYVSMYQAAAAQDVARVKQLQQVIMKLCTLIYNLGKTNASYLQGIKCALNVAGLCEGYISYPFRQFGEEEKSSVRAALDGMKYEIMAI